MFYIVDMLLFNIKYSNFLLMFLGLVVGEEYVFKSDIVKIRIYMICKVALLLFFIISSIL